MTGFSSESSLKIYEAMYKEIDSLLFNDNSSSKKFDHDKKDSGRKSSTRKDSSRLGSKGFTKTSKAKQVEFKIDTPPVWKYDISQDLMVGMITRAANFTKKQMAKLNRIAQLPPKKLRLFTLNVLNNNYGISGNNSEESD